MKNEKIKSKNFLLICGFENFNEFYVRVDILERLFLKIINITKNGKFIINSDMINLIGCTKENFYKLLNLMEYKEAKNKESKEITFFYSPRKISKKIIKNDKKYQKDSPFQSLSEVRFK